MHRKEHLVVSSIYLSLVLVKEVFLPSRNVICIQETIGYCRYSVFTHHKMGKYNGKTCRLLCMLSLTASFFLVEITVGFVTNSLALVGDSYHMLSDVIAIAIGLASVRVSPIDYPPYLWGAPALSHTVPAVLHVLLLGTRITCCQML